MATFGITAVRWSEDQRRAVYVQIREIDPVAKVWLGEPKLVFAHTVAKWLLGGDTVMTIFEPEENVRILGMNVKYVEYPGGNEGIETGPTMFPPGWGLSDLPHF